MMSWLPFFESLSSPELRRLILLLLPAKMLENIHEFKKLFTDDNSSINKFNFMHEKFLRIYWEKINAD